MSDQIYDDFLDVQRQEGQALAEASDILDLETDGTARPQRYIARFRCRGIIKMTSGEILEASLFTAGIWFPTDYMRSPATKQVVTMFPPWLWHPNAAGPFICLGKLAGGTSLVDILFQIFELISYQRWSAHDGLNEEACEWARNNQQRFPVDRRPLKWKEVQPA